VSEKGFLSKALTDVTLKRRSFLKWSSALSGTAVLSKGLTTGLKPAAKSAAAASEGEWIPVACWHNCGGRCVNKVLVQDGIVVRQQTDNNHEDSANYPQQRGCARGRSQRRQVFGADRIKYPMKRKNWEPGTGGKRELRGRDEWVRISWDEALDLVVNEAKRVLDEHGNKAILSGMGGSPVLSKLGGTMENWGTVSEGSWPQPAIHMAGGACYPNDRMDYRNTKQIVFWGANPIWSSGGNPTYNYLEAKKASGAQVIVVDPFYNDSAQVLADHWVPIRPGTDAAALIGIAYHMIENDLQDQDFLDKYTVGFDADHMPEGIDRKENFKDYVLGTYDGVPKTPEWASNICGTPPETLRWLAEQLASIKPTVLTCAAAPSRTYRGEQMVQAFLTIGWMTGNVGIPGGSVCQSYHSSASYGGPALVNAGGTGEPYTVNPLFPYFFPYTDLPDHEDWHGPVWDETWMAVLNGEYTAGTRGKVPCDIRMLWLISFSGSGNNLLNQIPDINHGIEAIRKLEFVVSSDIVLSTKSKYADIVLPTTTPWEKPGGLFSIGGGEALLYYSQVTEPLYEARDEAWIERELAKRMGVDPDEIAPLSETQKMFNAVAGATVIKDDTSGYEPLVTITEEDIAELGVEGKPQKGRVPFKEFKQSGSYQVPREPGDKFGYITAQAFREDPEENPLPTKSGKLEIHCQTLADRIAAYGYITIPPIAQYHPPLEGYEDTYSNFKGSEKGEYPLQLVTIHYGRRSHSVFDNIKQLRGVFPQEFMINAIDAEARGIEHGDTILIRSRHGKVLRRAFVTERLTPGVVYLGEGAWVQMDEEKGVDLAGATNTLSGSNPTGQGVQPWNTCNVQVEKWDGDPLDPDVEWPQRIVL